MCGIVGYIGWREAAPLLLKGLTRLEYRGYDSAGVALLNESLLVMKQKDTITIATSGAITAASSATSTVTDPQHSHAPPSNQFILSGAGSAGVAGGVGFNQAATTANATTGITVATSVTTTITNGQTITATSGLTGTSQNMPPAAIVNKIIYCGA